MKKWALLMGLLIAISLIAACGGGDTATPEGPDLGVEPTSTMEAILETPSVESLSEPQVVPIEQVINFAWQWSELVEAVPASQSVVPDPENYTLELWADESFNFKADCNVGSGTYSADDNGNIALELGAITRAECGPESLSDQYLTLLNEASNFGMVDGRFALLSGGGNALMTFNFGGRVEKPEPGPTVCAGIDMQSLIFDVMGLPYSWQANCVEETDYVSGQPSGATGLPQHVQINFGVADPGDRKYGDPILYVIPVAEYEQKWLDNADPAVSNAIDQLQLILTSDLDPVPTADIPTLPFEEIRGELDLGVQADYLEIKMGSGIRLVGRTVEEPTVVSNDQPPLFYIFNGFTPDGVYLISFFYPVSTDVLPDSGEISETEIQAFESDATAYLEAVASELQTLSPTDWEPSLTTLDGVINSLEFQYEAPEVAPAEPSLTNVNWQWFELVETDPASQSVIPNPESYVVIFLNDGTFDILADCNFGNGTYALDGNNISITIEAITEIECEPGSSSEQFIEQLGNVATYELSLTKLNLNLSEGAGRLGFVNGGPALIPPTPGEGVPTGTTTEPVNVRSGPGTIYTSFGVVPAGTNFEVVGISEDRTFWVVRVPTDVSLSGQGWISVAYLETENTDDVPEVPAPPIDGQGELPANTPIAVALEPINIRSGPGTDYPSYGIASIGATGVVIGRSEDSTWWVIRLPTSIASDGRGWVSATYVEVNNVENVPVMEPPPLP